MFSASLAKSGATGAASRKDGCDNMPSFGRSSQSLDSPGVTSCIAPDLYPPPPPEASPQQQQLPPKQPQDDDHGGIMGFHGMVNPVGQPVQRGGDSLAVNFTTGLLETPHDELQLWQRRRKPEAPTSSEQRLFGSGGLRRADPKHVPAAGSDSPSSPVPGMAPLAAPSSPLFKQKDHAAKPSNQLRQSMQGAITPRDEDEMSLLLRHAHAEGTRSSSSPSPSPPRHNTPHEYVAEYYMPKSTVQPAGVASPQQDFPHKRMGAFTHHSHLSGSQVAVNKGEGVLS